MAVSSVFPLIRPYGNPLFLGKRARIRLRDQHVQVHWCFCTSAPSLTLDLLSGKNGDQGYARGPDLEVRAMFKNKIVGTRL